MTPYYEADGVTIFCGDVFAVLREVAITGLAAVVTDVPYASGTRHEAAKPASGAMRRGERFGSRPIENDQMTTTGFVWMVRELCYAVRPLLIEGGSVLTFIDWRQWPNLVGAVETTNLRVNSMIVWDKESFGMGWGYRGQHELILHASKGVPRIVNRGVGNVLRYKRDDEELHPSPKPVELMQRLLDAVCQKEETVLDPFMGAGATLVAAKQLGCRAVGIEIEERYCEIAAKRLSQGVFAWGD
jgi:DNA modification methylase